MRQQQDAPETHTYFAEIASDGIRNSESIVARVVVGSDCDTEALCESFFGGRWKQTWLNGGPRKNYAGIGYLYDEYLDAFIEPRPYPSWSLDEATCSWRSPSPKPTDSQFYSWDESDLQWRPSSIAKGESSAVSARGEV